MDYVGDTYGASVANSSLSQGVSHTISFALQEPAVAVGLIIETSERHIEVQVEANGTVKGGSQSNGTVSVEPGPSPTLQSIATRMSLSGLCYVGCLILLAYSVRGKLG